MERSFLYKNDVGPTDASDYRARGRTDSPLQLREQESHSSFTDMSASCSAALRPLPRRAAWRQCFPQDAVRVFGWAV